MTNSKWRAEVEARAFAAISGTVDKCGMAITVEDALAIVERAVTETEMRARVHRREAWNEAIEAAADAIKDEVEKRARLAAEEPTRPPDAGDCMKIVRALRKEET